jgi:hypothetical protein
MGRRNIRKSDPRPSPCPDCAERCAEAIKYRGLGMVHLCHRCPGLPAVRRAISQTPRHIVIAGRGRVSRAASVGAAARRGLGEL